MSPTSDNLIEVCQHYGMKFVKIGGEQYAQCPFHTDGKRPNFRVNEAENTWYCDVCKTGGGVVQFISKKENRNPQDVYREMEGRTDAPQGKIVSTYDYTDQLGNLLYQVCRMDPKSFRQRRPDGKGGWIWNMQGVDRVPYNLRQVLNPKNKHIWIVEGEKDVETLRKIGFAATTNVSGAGKWLDGYSEWLKDKEVILCGDNDKVGKDHMKKVAESLAKWAASIRHIELPEQFKDVSDFAASFNSSEKCGEALGEMVVSATVLLKGGILPIKSMAELEAEYIEHVRLARSGAVDLSRWIPSLRCVRPLVAGELVSVVGDTGTAKTYVLQHLAMMCGVPTLLFELELPGSLTFERFVAIAREEPGEEIYTAYNSNQRKDYSDLTHIYTCTRSRVSPDDIQSIVSRAEVKMGTKPSMVLVDYIQLVSGFGKSRYEKMSDIAERLKVVAKDTGTVVVMASQVGRDKESPEIALHDAKDSGSIENSSGVMIGIWRDPKEANILNLKVLKQTKGRPSRTIQCLIKGESMRIVEKSPIDPSDYPTSQPFD